jgi:hypothetical protein
MLPVQTRYPRAGPNTRCPFAPYPDAPYPDAPYPDAPCPIALRDRSGRRTAVPDFTGATGAICLRSHVAQGHIAGGRVAGLMSLRPMQEQGT